ncbi:hypothetical protein KVT40_001946 [Elsinoe batatas]|uniref:AB hydrolase-1 domain-containing protein n=1 Tax=Elsinoe batatas TaxID=2601811 RepID=A0A8K0L7F5_9PEZI|nr:hypothetical protein KVT40_001946 [Elsinoe batatas]
MASSQRIPVKPAEIIEQRSYQVPGKLLITEHHFSIPSSHSDPTSTPLRIFARSARRPAPPGFPLGPTLPYLVYLNGGPGHACHPPQSYPFTPTLLDKGYTLLFLDQRGTGLSTPISASTLAQRGDMDVQARHLKLYRADNIVRDLEAIRLALTATEQRPAGEKWSIFGQSFGGFISVSYLSFYPEGLRESFIFGGLMPLVREPGEVYRRLFRVVERRNEVYYAKFPEDVGRVKSIVRFLGRWGDGKVRLPGGGALTGRLFLTLGIGLGFHGGVDLVHNIVLKASTEIEMFGHITRGTLNSIESFLGWDNAPIYSVLHEPIYTVGKKAGWAAQKVREELPQFAMERLDSIEPLLFTGEMIFPWMFDDCPELSKMKDVAEKVAQDEDWPELYDLEQLKKNEVPVYAAAYTEDMYVDFDFSKETAAAIKGCKMFSTNVMYHNAIREKKEVVDQLFLMREDVID